MAMHMGVWLKNLGFLFAKHGFRANGSRVVGMDVGVVKTGGIVGLSKVWPCIAWDGMLV